MEKDEIPAFERVEDPETRIYPFFYMLGFKNGVRAPFVVLFLICLILTIVFAIFVPPSKSTWLLYGVPTGLFLWLVSRIKTQGRSFMQYWASTIRYQMRRGRTMVGRKVYSTPVKMKKPKDLAQQ